MASRNNIPGPGAPHLFQWRLMAAFFGLILFIGLTGWIYLRANRTQIREAAGHELRSVTDLKVAQIAQWQYERLADARVIAENALIARDIAAWRSDPGNRDLERGLRQWLESVQRNYRYKAVHLLDPQGGVLMAALAPEGVFVEADRLQAMRCLAERTVILSDLYRDPGLQKVHQELCVPIAGSPADPIAAIMVLQIDPDQFLYPMIRTWPTVSRTAESLLVRRDGDQVLFLNELRHWKGGALNLRLPADAPLLPAALAVRGVTGTVEGVDYRGRSVMASIRPIPDSNWFMVCKVDKDEIYQPFYRLIWPTGLVMLALILLSALWIHRLWKQQREQWADERRQALEQSEKRYRALFEGMTEGFALHEIICDDHGAPRDYRFLEINPAFERLTGLKREQVVGRTVLEVLPGTESRWIEAYGRVALTGEAVHFDQSHGGLGRHFDVFAYRPAPGQFAVLFMDITERKIAEEALRESEERLLRAQEIAHLGSWELDIPSNELTWSKEVYRIFGLEPGEFPTSYEAFLDCVHPEDRKAVDEAYSSSLLEGRNTYEIEHRVVRQSTGEVRTVLERCQHFRDAAGNRVRSVGMVHDITERRKAEVTLRQSEATLRGILDATQESIWLFSPDGTALAGNETAFRRFGKPAGEIIGRHLTDFLLPELAASRTARLREVVASGLPVEFEDERSGVLFHHSFYPVKDVDGRVTAVAVYSRDITRHRRAEEDLRQSEARFRIALQSSPITVATLDRDLRYTWVYNTRHGFDPGQVLGRRPDELIPSEDAADLVAFLERALAAGVPQRDTVEGRTRGERWVYDITAEPLTDGLGRPAGLTIALFDVTDRTRMEEDLRELERFKLRERSQREWQDTFDRITDPISIHDRHGILLKANRAFMEYFKLSAADLGTLHCSRLFDGMGFSTDDCPMRRNALAGACETRELADPERGRIVEMSTFLRESPQGKPEGSIHIIKDVTHRKENEMQLIMNERLAALGQMAAGIAHEINNPLATIAGCAEGLLNRTRKGQLEPTLFQDYLGIIEEEIARCKAITASMLTFVRKGDPQRQVLNVHEVLDRTLELIGFQGRLRNVELLKAYAAWDEPVRAAEVEMKQVFVALLSNALDAMGDAGSLAIATDGNAGTIRITIRDSGPGVPPAIAERIFDPFFTTKAGEGGTGLGLSIARRIVESMGGTLTLDSAPGEGATATLTLPRAVPDPAPGPTAAP